MKFFKFKQLITSLFLIYNHLQLSTISANLDAHKKTRFFGIAVVCALVYWVPFEHPFERTFAHYRRPKNIKNCLRDFQLFCSGF